MHLLQLVQDDAGSPGEVVAADVHQFPRPLDVARVGSAWPLVVAPARRLRRQGQPDLLRSRHPAGLRHLGGQRAACEEVALDVVAEEQPVLRVGPQPVVEAGGAVGVVEGRAVLLRAPEATLVVPDEEFVPRAGDPPPSGVPVVMVPVDVAAVEVDEEEVDEVRNVEVLLDLRVGLRRLQAGVAEAHHRVPGDEVAVDRLAEVQSVVLLPGAPEVRREERRAGALEDVVHAPVEAVQVEVHVGLVRGEPAHGELGVPVPLVADVLGAELLGRVGVKPGVAVSAAQDDRVELRDLGVLEEGVAQLAGAVDPLEEEPQVVLRPVRVAARPTLGAEAGVDLETRGAVGVDQLDRRRSLPRHPPAPRVGVDATPKVEEVVDVQDDGERRQGEEARLDLRVVERGGRIRGDPRVHLVIGRAVVGAPAGREARRVSRLLEHLVGKDVRTGQHLRRPVTRLERGGPERGRVLDANRPGVDIAVAVGGGAPVAGGADPGVRRRRRQLDRERPLEEALVDAEVHFRDDQRHVRRAPGVRGAGRRHQVVEEVPLAVRGARPGLVVHLRGVDHHVRDPSVGSAEEDLLAVAAEPKVRVQERGHRAELEGEEEVAARRPLVEERHRQDVLAGNESAYRGCDVEASGAARLGGACRAAGERRLLSRREVDRGDAHAVEVDDEAVVVAGLKDQVGEQRIVAELETAAQEDGADSPRELGVESVLAEADRRFPLRPGRVVEARRVPVGGRPGVRGHPHEVAPRPFEAHEVRVEGKRGVLDEVRRKLPAVLAGAPDEEVVTGAEAHRRKHPLPRVAAIVAQPVARQGDRALSGVVELDPVGAVVVLVEDRPPVARQDLVDHHLRPDGAQRRAGRQHGEKQGPRTERRPRPEGVANPAQSTSRGGRARHEGPPEAHSWRPQHRGCSLRPRAPGGNLCHCPGLPRIGCDPAARRRSLGSIITGSSGPRAATTPRRAAPFGALPRRPTSHRGLEGWKTRGAGGPPSSPLSSWSSRRELRVHPPPPRKTPFRSRCRPPSSGGRARPFRWRSAWLTGVAACSAVGWSYASRTSGAGRSGRSAPARFPSRARGSPTACSSRRSRSTHPGVRSTSRCVSSPRTASSTSGSVRSSPPPSSRRNTSSRFASLRTRRHPTIAS